MGGSAVVDLKGFGGVKFRIHKDCMAMWFGDDWL